MDLAPEDTVQVMVMDDLVNTRGLRVPTEVDNTAPEMMNFIKELQCTHYTAVEVGIWEDAQ